MISTGSFLNLKTAILIKWMLRITIKKEEK